MQRTPVLDEKFKPFEDFAVDRIVEAFDFATEAHKRLDNMPLHDTDKGEFADQIFLVILNRLVPSLAELREDYRRSRNIAIGLGGVPMPAPPAKQSTRTGHD